MAIGTSRDFSLAGFVFRCTGGGMRIGTARDTVLVNGRGVSLRAWLVRMAGAHRLGVDDSTPGDPVEAFIEYGRWAAKCPVCGQYVDVDPAEPVWLCVSCGGMLLAARVSAVVFPDNRSAIETELLRRAHLWNRNWYPGETVADLQAEYAELEGGAG